MVKHDTLLLACGTAENRKLLRSVFEESYNLLEAVNSRQTILLLEQNVNCIAAVLLDVTNPDVLEEELLTGSHAGLLSQVPIIVMSSDDDNAVLSKSFGFGAADVIPLNYDAYAMVHRIENIVDLHLHKRNLEAMVEEQANILRHSNETMVDVLSSIIEYRSVESGQHILRIRHFTKILLEELVRFCPEYALTDTDVALISSASALHDIGKIAIPDSILTKPGKLTEEEWEVMKTHAITGCEILQSLGNMGDPAYLRYAHNICHYHHERWDGSGYPEGLSGEAIPICAQVVSLADVYDALTTKRVYKDAYSFDTAVNMIINGECGAFSPKLLECFKHVTDKYEALARAYADGLSPETETFDVALPTPAAVIENDSMERTWAKYQALVHYVNVFLLELDLDQGLFHLVYNPYPELVSFHDVSSFADLEQRILDTIVVPEERPRMLRFIHEDISGFMQEGLRRVSHTFRFRSRAYPQGETFEVTLLRINPTDAVRRTLAVLCRRAERTAPVQENTVSMLAESTYYCRYDQDFTLEQVGRETHELAGYSPEEIQTRFGSRLIELAVPEDRDRIRREFQEQLFHGTGVKLEYRVRHKDGRILWVLNKSRLVADRDGREYIYSFLTDITPTKQVVDTLNERLQRYEIILAQTENVLFEWDMLTDKITFSDTWERLFGFTPISANVRDSLLGGSYFHPDDLPLLFDRISAMRGGSSYEVAEVRIATAKGRYLWCRFRASAIRDQAGNLQKIVGIIINIDAEKQAEKALQDRAERDALTKLLNKHTGRKQAEEYFAQYPQGVSCALLIIDLDNFKEVNDRHGHLFGDTVLTKVAREIKKLFRAQDILARIGGDEFMVLMRGVSDRTLVESRCARLLSLFHTLFQNQRCEVPLSCSIGIALSPQHGTSYYDLFQRADQALYRAKDQGKGGFVFYNGKDSAFRSGAMRTTAVNNHIDSDEQPGLADSNIVQYAFQRLYSSQDVAASVNHILDMIGRQMNVSRVYVFENSPDNRFCSNTYEWCNEGIQPEIQNLQNISYETDIPGYADNFDEQGIFYCPDISVLPKAAYDIVAPQGIKSMLHCAIRDNGVFRGYIGFDECVTQRMWTKEQIQILTYFSEMLSVFLLKKQERENALQQARELRSILDNQNAWIYIIDPDTCELKYLNAKTKALAPNAKPGMSCYQALMGREERCRNCPSARIRETKNGSTVVYNHKFDLNILSEATLIQWEGTPSCLLTCRKIPKDVSV